MISARIKFLIATISIFISSKSVAEISLKFAFGTGYAALYETPVGASSVNASGYEAYPLGSTFSWTSPLGEEGIWQFNLRGSYHQWIVSRVQLNNTIQGIYSGLGVGAGLLYRTGPTSVFSVETETVTANSLAITSKKISTINSKTIESSTLNSYEGDSGLVTQISWFLEDNEKDIRTVLGLSIYILNQKFNTKKIDTESNDQNVSPSKLTTEKGLYELSSIGLCLDIGFKF